MNAKQRYRKRLKVRQALARLIVALDFNRADGIPPDRETALLAAEALRGLLPYLYHADVDLKGLLTSRPDLSHVKALLDMRRKQTQATYRSRLRQPHCPWCMR